MHPYDQQAYSTTAQGYYPGQHQDGYENTLSGYGASYHPPNGGMAIDPELEQAMQAAFGSEGAMMGNFFYDFFAMGSGVPTPSVGESGLGYEGGAWYPEPGSRHP